MIFNPDIAWGILSFCTLVFEIFLKLGKLQCKSNFNRKGTFTDDRKTFETPQRQIVLYLPGIYDGPSVMCDMSHVTCQPFPSRKS